MAVVSTRTSNRIRFTFYVEHNTSDAEGNSEYAFDIKDDGYALRICKEDGTQIAMLHPVGDRQPDKSSAAALLQAWAVERWGN